MSSIHRIALLLLPLACLPVSSGCIALGIPSDRFHDPDDHGGLVGNWKRGRPHTTANHTAALLADGAVLANGSGGHAADGSCVGSGCSSVNNEAIMPLDLDPMTGEPLSRGKKPPKVPWPRFHPVPTKPVFGSGI